MKLIVGYLATPGGADALALGVRLARTLGAELGVSIILPPDRMVPSLVPVGGYDEHLAEQAEHWLAEARASIPADVVAGTHVSFDDSYADGLIKESARLQADLIVVGGSGGGLAGPYSLGSVVNELLHSAPVPVAVAPRGSRHLSTERVREVTCAIGERQGADLLLDTAVRASNAAGTPLRLVSLVALDPMFGSLRGDDDAVRERALAHAQQTLETAQKRAARRLSGDVDHRRRADRRSRGQQAGLARRRPDHGRVEPAERAQAPLPRIDRGQDVAGAGSADGGCAQRPVRSRGPAVSDAGPDKELKIAEESAGLVSKGLATGKVGTFSGAMLGISSVAPGYTLTASIGLIVAAVGLKMPAIFIAGFIPMFLTAYAYRELNSRAPDCGASFTWSTKAFGPYVGWMCGWGMVIATIIVLSNLAAIAVEFFYLFIARIVQQPRHRRPRRQQGRQHRRRRSCSSRSPPDRQPRHHHQRARAVRARRLPDDGADRLRGRGAGARRQRVTRPPGCRSTWTGSTRSPDLR